MNNPEFEKFLSLAGSQAKAARMLGCTEAAISNYKHGKHGLSKDRVQAITELYPNLNALSLMFPEQAA